MKLVEKQALDDIARRQGAAYVAHDLGLAPFAAPIVRGGFEDGVRLRRNGRQGQWRNGDGCGRDRGSPRRAANYGR
ncbi:hypothetical protein FHS91_003792 [Sphingobium xanthum]|uniref:hypothetical protein n=1 Tax=Sphingobium xanthum TaxID=1387165 RepID=UPI001C8C8834|nr:hypothetical protein [Sphingobium xanthum]